MPWVVAANVWNSSSQYLWCQAVPGATEESPSMAGSRWRDRDLYIQVCSKATARHVGVEEKKLEAAGSRPPCQRKARHVSAMSMDGVQQSGRCETSLKATVGP
jgi:hypothetical protein